MNLKGCKGERMKPNQGDMELQETHCLYFGVILWFSESSLTAPLPGFGSFMRQYHHHLIFSPLGPCELGFFFLTTKSHSLVPLPLIFLKKKKTQLSKNKCNWDRLREQPWKGRRHCREGFKEYLHSILQRFLCILFKYGWFTMLINFKSTVKWIAYNISILFFSHIGYFRTLNRPPCLQRFIKGML